MFHTQGCMQITCVLCQVFFYTWAYMCLLCLCVSATFVRLIVTHTVVRGRLFVCAQTRAYAASPSGWCRCRVCVCVCVCVCVSVCACLRAASVRHCVSFCKLERHVAGWNPIRVHCQHAAVLTWYACYSNLVVKNRLSLGYFSGEFCCFKATLILHLVLRLLSCNYFLFLSLSVSLCCTGERADARRARW